MDELSIILNNSGTGGYLGDAFLNHLCYADHDDLSLISLSFNLLNILKPFNFSVRSLLGC